MMDSNEKRGKTVLGWGGGGWGQGVDRSVRRGRSYSQENREPTDTKNSFTFVFGLLVLFFDH